jgi:CMP-N,N'-diacetyllegionaminic acid synthase
LQDPVPDDVHVVAVIPARAGSKRLPRKNVRQLGGRPLISYSIEHARAARWIREIYVSTDDAEIGAIAAEAGAIVVERPADLSSDTASSESAILHVLDEHRSVHGADPDLVVFLQATSPIRRGRDVDAAIETLIAEGADSLFSACRSHAFIWAVRDNGLVSLTYDYGNRPRGQDFEAQFAENGSIYVFRTRVLRQEGNRLGGRIAVYEMDEWSSFQIDTAEDAAIVEWILDRIGSARRSEN